MRPPRRIARAATRQVRCWVPVARQRIRNDPRRTPIAPRIRPNPARSGSSRADPPGPRDGCAGTRPPIVVEPAPRTGTLIDMPATTREPGWTDAFT